ncbi:cytochrome P450 9e2-like [Odontomachus brunneus]|uniref:cytochrome P450 9e2-like n=1 Tax=Odontomachus brunneus TaxID=486640 RepID=UPI0013F19F35|nr:cytochrome P450 9e2-like [Odontomachus brunneus]
MTSIPQNGISRPSVVNGFQTCCTILIPFVSTVHARKYFYLTLYDAAYNLVTNNLLNIIYVIVLSLIAGTLVLYYFLFQDINLFEKHNILHVRPLPLIGNKGPFITRMMSMAELLKQLYDVHTEAKYIGMYYTKPVIILRDIELVKSITVKNFDAFMDHRVFLRGDQDSLFGKNLLSLQGDK